MMKKNLKLLKKNSFLFIIFILTITETYARLGGGGGRSRSSSSSGGSHFGGGHFSGGHFDGSGGGGSLDYRIILVIIVIYLIYQWYTKKNGKKNIFDTEEDFQNDNYQPRPIQNLPFPEGLNAQKVRTAFLEMQKAWQNQELSSVRKWMSDGLYQKLSVQIKMMQKLSQHNVMDNIKIQNISVENTFTYNDFQIVDVRIDFELDDTFYSDKFKSMKESYEGDYAIEYYSFIKKGNSIPTTDLYSGNNCPNCGTLITNDLGEISRCPSCKTLTNNPTYDWVLCEITQEENFNEESRLNYDETLKELCKFDDNFNIQSLEDIASNICMQIFDVLTGGKEIKLERFAHQNLKEEILSLKQNSFNNVVFERLYLKEVTTRFYSKTADNKIEVDFYAEVCGKRVRLENDTLKEIDDDLTIFPITLSLIKGISQEASKNKEVVYSYECSNCGAPYDDTTHDTCNYCESVVVDESKNWVLSKFDLSL
ncbi:TIM44-like domain-containing protein [Flavobacterium oreochromis]|uniref:TIM44-like domain-containing protein n=2 Tax=Flavobacterium oreochromis TaxID=2906078 RepID=UPI00386003FA